MCHFRNILFDKKSSLLRTYLSNTRRSWTLGQGLAGWHNSACTGNFGVHLCPKITIGVGNFEFCFCLIISNIRFHLCPEITFGVSWLHSPNITFVLSLSYKRIEIWHDSPFFFISDLQPYLWLAAGLILF